MSFNNERREERALEVISNFKQIVDRLYEKKIKMREFQAAISEYLDDDDLSSELKIEVINLTIHALPKSIYGTYFFLLEDVAQYIRVFRRLKKKLGKYKGSTFIQLEEAADNIKYLFQDAFFKNLSDQIAKEEDYDERIDESAMEVAGDAQKSYNKHLKRETRRRLKEEETDPDEDDENDDDGDDDDDL